MKYPFIPSGVKIALAALIFACTQTTTPVQNKTPITLPGSKLFGTDAVGSALQGYSVSISSDGNTAIVGGILDNNFTGATWVFTRSNGIWTQQGSKLVGSGAVGRAQQGYSVSLSGDGNTAIVGTQYDNSGAGAAWVFTRSNGIWTQQGSKLVGSGTVGSANQGASVAISSDGNTVIVGGWGDNGSIGAAWVWARSGGDWIQQGNKLVGSGGIYGNDGISQGSSVSLSSDGNTAIVGGTFDNNNAGAAWVWARSGGVWIQQGSKLVGSGAGSAGIGARQGRSVSLSADGHTAIVGGDVDNGGAGAAWVWIRTDGVWTQQGGKLVGTGDGRQGWSVSLSSDGNIAVVGGVGAWVWARSVGVWTQQGSVLYGTGTGAIGWALPGYSVSLSSDGNTVIVGGVDDSSGATSAWVYTRQ